MNRKFNQYNMLAGRTGAYGRSPYCATKFGVEAVSDCLRMEMKKFNVDVSEFLKNPIENILK
jgi:NADP-dependent 3-hydroxy acid dehydrogenase YdfG